MIISILLGVVFIAFLAHAIFETIWGLCLIAYGIVLIAISYVLKALALLVRGGHKIRNKFRKPKPRRMSVVRSFALVYGSSK